MPAAAKVDPADEGDHDTVGAVALDCHGRVAAATSTGGLTAKWPGRVGDSPILGSGGWASDIGAVSTTGTGELILRAQLAKSVCDAMEYRVASRVDDAAVVALHRMQSRVGGDGAGLIAIVPPPLPSQSTGSGIARGPLVAIAHSTERMSHAARTGR
jgi:L-asparaginase / beta-aspartyl-peptidase